MRKRTLALFIVVLVSALLISCETTRNTYSTNTYSSKYSKNPLGKEGTIAICVPITDYNFQRPFELELKKLFEEKGFDVEIMSDYNHDNPYEFIFSLDPRYVLYITYVDGSLYTYEYGGGISRIGFLVEVFDANGFDTIMKIRTSVSGTDNNMESFISSEESVSRKLSKDIVEEFCKYF